MNNRNDIFTPQNNPQHIALFYTDEGDIITITLDLSEANFSLSYDERQTLWNLHSIREKCVLAEKTVILVVHRNILIETIIQITQLLVSHIQQK
jgi:hypothetical protein